MHTGVHIRVINATIYRMAAGSQVLYVALALQQYLCQVGLPFPLYCCRVALIFTWQPRKLRLKAGKHLATGRPARS